MDSKLEAILDNALADVSEDTKKKVKKSVKKSIKRSVKQKVKKRRRAFFRRILILGILGGIGYLVYRKSDKAQTKVREVIDVVVTKVPFLPENKEEEE